MSRSKIDGTAAVSKIHWIIDCCKISYAFINCKYILNKYHICSGVCGKIMQYMNTYIVPI